MFSQTSLQIHKLIQDSFPHTYFVGGAVRNILLGEKITDYDISTSATPNQLTKLFAKHKIQFDDSNKNFGAIVVTARGQKIEVTTFRKDVYSNSRFPKVSFVTSPKTDSNRRDFTINAIYLNPVNRELLDFHGGLQDIRNRRLKFIGDPKTRIAEDPLRIIRALRFSWEYNLLLDPETEKLLYGNIALLKTLSPQRIEKEINSLKQKILRQKLQKVIHSIY